jgi:RimJ/RimL family protein N-acetyltransferase
MEILSEGIILRPWKITDADRLAQIADNRRIADNLRDGFPNPYTKNDAISWLNSVLPENNPPRFFAIVTDGIIAGSIGIVPKPDIYRKNVEIGYFLAEAFWGKGIATKAIKAATSYAFRNFDIERAYAEPFADNKGSRKALEKAGFHLEAVLRNYVIKNEVVKDSCIYSVLKNEYIAD